MPTGIPSAVDLIIKADGINSPDLTLKVQVSRVPVSESEDEYLSSSRRHETALTSPVMDALIPTPATPLSTGFGTYHPASILTTEDSPCWL